MQPTTDDLIAGIAKGTLQSKLGAYRLLLIRDGHNSKAVTAMENKLATEPTPGIFKIVKNLDQDSGPYLDWPTILRRRLSECKSVDGRYDTIGSEFDYGPDAVEVLSKTALKDEDDETRAWAMLTLARQSEETLDPLIHDVAMQYLCLLYTSPSPRDRG